MNTPQMANLHRSRRRFLKALAWTGAVGITAAGGVTLLEYAPWLDDTEPARLIRRPFDMNSTPSVKMRELIRYASLAANGHNTQPWKFAIATDAIQIHPDYARRLTIVDPDDRELWMSLGCALENLLIAARAAGYTPEVTYPDAQDFINVRLLADTLQPSPLFDAIPTRQNTRSEYDGQPVPVAQLDQLLALNTEPDVSLRLFTSPAEVEHVLEYVHQGSLIQYGDAAFRDELIEWLRFTRREAISSMDGLYSRCSGNPEVPRWLGQLYVGGTDARQQAEADARKLRSSSGAVVIASQADDRAGWVRTGQVYERMALWMTSVNIKSAFLNQPIEVAGLRSQFQSAIGLDASVPQLLLRFGYADILPPSFRRPVEQILI